MEENNKQNKKWICVQITHRYNKSQHVKTVKNFLYTMFQPQKILFLGSSLDEQNFNNVMDGYFFIQCNEVQPFLQVLKNSKYINNILISFDRVHYIDDCQVMNMVRQYQKKYDSRQNQLKYGDVVKVKKGMFKNLYAVVNQIKNQHQVVGVFKFVSGYRLEKLDVDNCEKQNNLFDFIKVAV